MKTILSIIILTIVSIGLWQNQELSHLKARESELLLRAKKESMTASASDQSSAVRPARPDARPSLDPKAFVKRFEELIASKRKPSDDERIRFGESLASASPRELKLLTEEIRNSSILPRELKGGIFTAIAPRLAEEHPQLAAEISLEGGEGNSFRAVMRTWFASDPQAALGWLEKRDPPLDVASFRSMEDLDLKILSLTASIVGDASGGGLEKLLEGNDKQLRAGLGEVMMSTTPADFSKIVKRISQDTHLPEEKRLELVGSTLARHQDPAVARQILSDAALPPEQFIPAAAVLVGATDPSGMRTAMDWFLTCTTDGPDRAKAITRFWRQWNTGAPAEAAAYFQEKNLSVPDH